MARIPTQYEALDSEAFTREGGPAVDAHFADGIEGSHNRLQALPTQMFAMGMPTPTVQWGSVDNGLVVSTYVMPTSPWWRMLLPPFPHAKKPGHRRADYRVRARFAADASVDLRVTTDAAPDGVVTTVTGTGAWATYAVDDVPVDPGLYEHSGLWVRTDSLGPQATAYGSPTTGQIFAATDRFLICAAVGGVTVNTTDDDAPDDWGSQGYVVLVEDDSGNERFRAVIDIVREVGNNAYLLCDGITQGLRDALPGTTSGSAWEWTVHQPLPLELAGFAGAVRERS